MKPPFFMQHLEPLRSTHRSGHIFEIDAVNVVLAIGYGLNWLIESVRLKASPIMKQPCLVMS